MMDKATYMETNPNCWSLRKVIHILTTICFDALIFSKHINDIIKSLMDKLQQFFIIKY